MEEKNAGRKARAKVIILIAILALLAFGMFAAYQTFMPKGKTGAKEITVTVIHGDKSENEFTCRTDAAYLGEVLMKEAIADGKDGQYGLFITSADGETADDFKQQWWCITKAGKAVNTSADQTPIEDGDRFELILKEGY